MPVYQYECTGCKDQIEVFQKISDPELEKCEKCGGKLKKLISKSSFIFNCDGFYATDYKDKLNGNKKAPT
jgi:putative FmdB family regulatory protein